MNIRTVGNLAMLGSLLVGGYYAARDIRQKGWSRATLEGSSTPAGSLEDTLGKAAGIGVALFLLTRLAPAQNP